MEELKASSGIFIFCLTCLVIISFISEYFHLIFTASSSAPGLVTRKRKRDKYVSTK